MDLISNIKLFYPQILLGSFVGILLSCIGVSIVLRRMAFSGLTLSQAVSLSVAVSMFFNWQGNISIVLFSSILFIPVLVLYRNRDTGKDTLLGILFVCFAALSQILMSFGGNVQNHLLSAYFGDILTSSAVFNPSSIVILVLALLLFVIMYKRVLFLSFDEDEFRVKGFSPILTELIFYFSAIIILSVSVNLLGSFYTVAHLLIPVYTALFFARSMRFIFIFGVIFSFISTFSGFSISLIPLKYQGNEIFLPTSSIIIGFMTLLAFVIISTVKLKNRF